MVLFSLTSIFSLIASQKELPDHIKKHLGVKPQGQYTCRDLTPEETAQMNVRGEEEKIDIVRQISVKEWGPEVLVRFNQLSRQQVLEIYNKSVENTFRIPQAEPTITVIPNAHEKAVASYNAKKRAQLQSSYSAERIAKIKAYDRLAKGSLLFSGGVLALYAGDKFNLFSDFFSMDSRYYQAGLIFGLASSYYAYKKKQIVISMPLNLSEQQVNELLKKHEKAQEQIIKDVCRLQ
jgi:hypothetical protein